MSYKKVPSIKSHQSSSVKNDNYSVVLTSENYRKLTSKVEKPSYSDLIKNNIPHRIEMNPKENPHFFEELNAFAAIAMEKNR